MFRYKITIEYDGTNFSGWQKQNNSPSIQENIESSIFSFSGEKVNVYAAGRTDASVHAIAQVAHFDLKKNWDAKIIQNALNHFLKPFIAINDCLLVDSNFHARFSAKMRSYRYIIINRKPHLTLMRNRAWHVIENLSIPLMNEAAEYFIGTHDFTSFRTIICQANSPIKTINKLNISTQEDFIFFDISAPSFLHHMVRNIVGTLKYIGNEKWSPKKVIEIINLKDRSKAGPTAPACGLYFSNIIY